MQFSKTANADGTHEITKKAASNPNTKTDGAYNFAMNDGNGIVIVASNDGETSDVLSAIVNLNGNIDTNNGDIYVRAESFKSSASDSGKSEINFGNGANINAANINAKAHSTITDTYTVDNSDEYNAIYGDILDAIEDYTMGLADAQSYLNVNDGAVISATKDIILSAISDVDISRTTIMNTIAVDYVKVNVDTNATIAKNAKVSAVNLDVNAISNVDISTTVKTTNTLDEKINTEAGSYALGVNLINIDNVAEISNGANIQVVNDVSVLAQTTFEHNDTTKNGLIPVTDKNHGSVGAAVSVNVVNVDNKAVMNADLDIDGDLSVTADYVGSETIAVTGYSGDKGETGIKDKLLLTVKGMWSLDSLGLSDVFTRANALFNDVDVAAAIGVAVNNIVSQAQIGDSTGGIKPVIKAATVAVTSSIVDDGSNLYVSSEAENGETSAAGAIAVNYKSLNSNATVYGDLTLNGSDSENSNILTISSNTEISHPMAWLDWWENFKDIFSSENWQDAWNSLSENWNSIETNSVSDYLDYLTALSELSSLFDDVDFTLLARTLDFSNLGASGFFNTFANSKANAKSESGSTTAISGAIAVSIFDTNSNAQLMDDSSVTIASGDVLKSNIEISANASNEMWTAATLISLLNYSNLFSGASARDGSAYGGAVAFNYSDSNVTATVGKNVTIKGYDTASSVGDLSVEASEDGNYFVLTIGSSSADDSGLAGSIGMTVLGSGVVKAAIEEEANINAGKVTVSSIKNDNFINAVIAFANSEDSYGVGISGVVLTDTVMAYIAGNVTATDDIDLTAEYEKQIINENVNLGVAKEGSDAAESNKKASSILDNSTAGSYIDKITDSYKDFNNMGSIKSAWTKVKLLQQYYSASEDYSRTQNIDKDTAAYAGGINFDYIGNTITAYIADGANIQTAGNLNISATSSDNIVTSAVAASVNGKTGGGGAIMFDMIDNNISSYIEGATVDVQKALSINAKEDLAFIALSAGMAAAEDEAGAGNVSVALQNNDIYAGIADSFINTRTESDNSSISVNAENESFVVKAVGSAAVQSGGSSDSSGAVGATIDVDILCNTITAEIVNSTVNANNLLSINAANSDFFIVVDVAGSASSNASATAGTVGTYIAVSEINAGIKESNINTTFENSGTDKENQEVKISAASDYFEVAVVGTVAAGNKTGVGASVRADVISNTINSYVQNSTVLAKGALTMTNSDAAQSIAVAVAGSGSSSSSAGAGTAMVVVDATEQNNYIDNSTVTTNSVTLDSDKSVSTIDVTGAIAASAGSSGTSVGASVYALGIGHEVNTYINNSNITTTGDITLTSDFAQDSYSVVFGGAGGSGTAVSGAVSVLVNDSVMKTYISADEDSEKKNIIANEGKVTVKSTNDIYTLTVDGNASVSTSNGSAGAGVNVTVYDSDIEAGIKGVAVASKNGIDIEAKATQEHISTVVGASGGSSTSADGSFDTLVMSQDMEAYLKNSTVKTDGDVIVSSNDTLELTSVTGALAASTSSAAVGGSILTATITGAVKSTVDNVDIDKFSSGLGNLLVSAYQSDVFSGAAIGGAVGNSLTVAGTVDTIVITRDVDASINDLQNINDSYFSNVEVNAKGNTTISHGTGALGVSTGGAGVGGTVQTLVVDKNAKAEITNSTINSNGYLKNISQAGIDITSVAVGLAASSGTAVNGAVVTQVFNIDTNSTIDNSILNIIGEIENNSKYNSDIEMYIESAEGAGSAAIGGVVYSLVDNSSATAKIANNSIINSQSSINNVSKVDANYFVQLFNAAGAGSAAVNGTVNTAVLNTTSIASIENAEINNSGIINNTANNDTEVDVVMVQASASGTAAVNGGVSTVVSSKETQADITNSSINTKNDINVSAKSTEDIETAVAGGAVSGTAAITGAVNTIVSSNSVNAYISGSTLENSGYDITIYSSDILNMTSTTGTA